jgi:hypothetical protein
MKQAPDDRQVVILISMLAVGLFACAISPSSIASLLPTLETSLPGTLSTTPSPHGTIADAQTMLQEAVTHYQTVGREQALADFTNRVPPFFHLDLYVACIDSNLVQSANGGFPNLVGSSVEPLSRSQWDSATTGKIDSIDYVYLDPENNLPYPKTFYYEKVGVDVCGVGAYHP